MFEAFRAVVRLCFNHVNAKTRAGERLAESFLIRRRPKGDATPRVAVRLRYDCPSLSGERRPQNGRTGRRQQGKTPIENGNGRFRNAGQTCFRNELVLHAQEGLDLSQGFFASLIIGLGIGVVPAANK